MYGQGNKKKEREGCMDREIGRRREKDILGGELSEKREGEAE